MTEARTVKQTEKKDDRNTHSEAETRMKQKVKKDDRSTQSEAEREEI
jgi:hypothetical protein